MIKNVAIFSAGIVVSAVVFIAVVLPWYGREKYEFGHYQGEISAKAATARRVHEMLGSDLAKSEATEFFLDAKSTGIVVVQRGGVKTLRISEDEK